MKRPLAASIGGFIGCAAGLQTTYLVFAIIGAAIGAWLGYMMAEASGGD